MSLNPNIKYKIQEYFQKYLLRHNNKCSVYALLHNYKGDASVSELEIRKTYDCSLESGYLKVTTPLISKNDEHSIFVELSKPFEIHKKNEDTSIVISSPKLQGLSFTNLRKRNELIDSTDCFRYIIKSAKIELRIC